MTDETKELLALKKEFHQVFSRRMASFGFPKHRSGTYYVKTVDGRNGVTIFHNVRFGALDISASMSIKVDAVERVLFNYFQHRGTSLTTPGEFTVCENLGNIKNRVFRHWPCYNRADMLEAIIAIEELLLGWGLPFLAVFDSPESILNEMVASTERRSVLGHPALLYEKALVLMYVLNQVDLFTKYGPVFRDIAMSKAGPLTWERELFFNWITNLFQEETREFL